MPSTSLFVGNLPYSITEQDLRDAFERAGVNVSEIRIALDLDTGRSRGYGFVDVATEEDARLAIDKLDSSSLGGRPIKVSEAKARGKRP